MPPNGTANSLESWIWDSACSIRGAKADHKLYWRIGKRIQSATLADQRAAYGHEIVATLSQQLVAELGAGFAEKNLRRKIQFAEDFLNEATVAALRRQLVATASRHATALVVGGFA